MMSQLEGTLGQILQLLSTVALLGGVLMLLASLLSMKGPDGYIKGVLLIILAGWMAHPHL